MQTEDQLIPYHTTDLTGRRVLALAPHPDDETIGCGGALALHARANDPIKVVFLTNGAQGDTTGRMNRDVYVALRQQEAKEACARLGVTDLEFWPCEDRSLAGARGALRRLMDLIDGYRPDLVYAPSPLEFHPDHRAACILLCDAIASSKREFDVAFYEVGQPVRVNLLVDITPVLPEKEEAVKAYRSQLGERRYDDFTRGLNRYRSMTLPASVICAEGFSRWPTDIIRKIGPFSLPFQQVERLLPGPGEAGPLVSVIVRTKDRPALLSNALKSIAAQTYANLEIVLVNDGGQDVQDVATAAAGGIPLVYIAHKASEGRAAAANAGLKAANGLCLNFLDDDDVLYPDHIETLMRHLSIRNEVVIYSSVVSAYYNGPPEGPESCIGRVVHHNIDFDPDRLLFQNYIPIMSVLFHRDVLAQVDGFMTDLDLFEDWDFWIRASRYFTFYHVDEVTAEYRFYGAKTTEESHRSKYSYDASQARIFERAVPFLTGEKWIKFLESDLPDSLRRRKGVTVNDRESGQCREDLRSFGTQLEQLKTLLAAKAHELQEAVETLTETREMLDRLREENDQKGALLAQVLSSRGWRWLERMRRIRRTWQR
jgi:LmbE family N-acetylglucosaminyl deacetylase/glycosyltransferase involved in cell wall biosynthesis